jgi:hypothetical protein
MADFNRKKLQVFVSSTYKDLRHERQAAVEAILTAGHIPAGMELFTAGDESQMEVIKQWIDESDVYLLVLGGRYGSIEAKSGKSYIQLEYEYAISRKKPLFACVIKEEAIQARVKIHGTDVIEMDNQNELKAFRAEVLTRISKFWEDAKDIKITIMETLAPLAKRAELVGWVRPDTQSNVSALADEIARLSRENSRLREQVSFASPASYMGLDYSEMKALLEKKGLFETFIKIAMGGTELFMLPQTQTWRLMQIGLVTSDHSLTNEGRAFLNKYEASQINQSSLPQSAK